MSESEDDLVKIVETAAAKLGEHYEAVQILVSGPLEGGGTRCLKRGVGNFYARQGMAHEFINEDMAAETGRSVAAHLESQDE